MNIVQLVLCAVAVLGILAYVNLRHELARRHRRTADRFEKIPEVVFEHGTGIALSKYDCDRVEYRNRNSWDEEKRYLYFRKGTAPKGASYAEKNYNTGKIEFFENTTTTKKIK